MPLKFSNHVSFDDKDDLSDNSYVYIYNYFLKYVFTTFEIERRSFGVFRWTAAEDVTVETEGEIPWKFCDAMGSTAKQLILFCLVRAQQINIHGHSPAPASA